jgi:hypothetical protein
MIYVTPHNKHIELGLYDVFIVYFRLLSICRPGNLVVHTSTSIISLT